MRTFIVSFVVGLALLFLPGCKTPTPLTSATPTAPTAFDAFFSELRSGMSHDDFDRVVRDHQFKDGLMLLPVIVSLSDPNEHLHIPPHGVYAFYFDRERRLVTWERWAKGPDQRFRLHQ